MLGFIARERKEKSGMDRNIFSHHESLREWMVEKNITALDRNTRYATIWLHCYKMDELKQNEVFALILSARAIRQVLLVQFGRIFYWSVGKPGDHH
jgi:hypothetical protein